MALALGLGLSVWEVFPPGIWHDDGVYVLLGRSLAQGDGLRYLGVPGTPLAPKFPPLFPFLLSLIWRAFPAFPENVPVLAGLNLVLTAAAAGVFFNYVSRGLGAAPALALAGAVLAWLSAHLWRVSAIPLSEPLFLLTFLLALRAGARMEKEPRPGTIVVFLLAAGLATYARTLGVAVLGAGVGTLFLAGRRRASLGLAGGSIVVLLPWLLWSWWAGPTIPESLRDTLGSYSGWLLTQISSQPVEFLQFLGRNLGSLLGRISALLLPGLTGSWALIGLALLPVLVLGFREMLRRSRILVLALALSFFILLVWPFQDVRLVVPFQPLLVLSTVLGFWHAGRSLQDRPRLKGALTGVALAWCGLFVSVNVVRLTGGWIAEGYRIRSQALGEAVETILGRTPENAVIGAPELWPGIHLYTGRMAAPSARFRPLSGGKPVEGTPTEQIRLWREVGITHLLLEHGGLVHGEALNQVDAACPSGTVMILDQRPGQLLVWLDWDEACQERALALPDRGG